MAAMLMIMTFIALSEKNCWFQEEASYSTEEGKVRRSQK